MSARAGSRGGTMSKAWFITGASSGLGRHLTEVALSEGDAVTAAVQRPDGRVDIVNIPRISPRPLDPWCSGCCRVPDRVANEQDNAPLAGREGVRGFLSSYRALRSFTRGCPR